ncbi:MAG: hypothetical protein ACUVX8_03715 [Candidatus Zipacnadales bacterium]
MRSWFQARFASGSQHAEWRAVVYLVATVVAIVAAAAVPHWLKDSPDTAQPSVQSVVSDLESPSTVSTPSHSLASQPAVDEASPSDLVASPPSSPVESSPELPARLPRRFEACRFPVPSQPHYINPYRVNPTAPVSRHVSNNGKIGHHSVGGETPVAEPFDIEAPPRATHAPEDVE